MIDRTIIPAFVFQKWRRLLEDYEKKKPRMLLPECTPLTCTNGYTIQDSRNEHLELSRRLENLLRNKWVPTMFVLTPGLTSSSGRKESGMPFSNHSIVYRVGREYRSMNLSKKLMRYVELQECTIQDSCSALEKT